VNQAATDKSDGALVKKDDALVGAAVSAAVGLAVYGLRKALAGGGDHRSPSERDEQDARSEGRRPRGGALLTIWESGGDTLLPLAEHAAGAAGKWVAENSPAVVRERLIPRFIESFRDAA
jgi:hypothetical protein